MTWLVADAELFKRVEVGEELEVHMLGVQKEVEMKEAFLVGSSTFYVLPDPLHDHDVTTKPLLTTAFSIECCAMLLYVTIFLVLFLVIESESFLACRKPLIGVCGFYILPLFWKCCLLHFLFHFYIYMCGQRKELYSVIVF